MSKCIISVAYGEKYEKMGDLMIESFLKYNKGWEAVKIYRNAIRVPMACMPNGIITPFNACEIGRWIAMREQLDKYDEVLYCDNDIYWYGKYNQLKSGIVLYPHHISDKGRYNARRSQLYHGVYNAGIIFASGDEGKKACDFIINEVSKNPDYFYWSDNAFDPVRKGQLFLQNIESIIPEIGVDCKVDNNAGMDVAYWNLASGDRTIVEENGKFIVECNGKKHELVSFHFSNSCFNRLPSFGNAMKKLFDEYNSIMNIIPL